MKNLIQSVFILIAVLMSTTGAEEVVYAQVGETVTLKAPGGNFQKYYLYWYFGKETGGTLAWRNAMGGRDFSKDAHWRLSLSDESLIIKNIQQENFGTFICKLTLNSETIITTYKLLKLNVTMNPPSPLLPGQSVSLDCNAETQSQTTTEIHWLNPQGEKMKSNTGPLTVNPTSKYNGQWTCVVTNNKKENKAVPISVTVVDLSPAPLHPQYTSKSSPLTIPCSIPPHISWEQLKARGIQGVHWHFFPKPGSGLISDDPQRLFSLSLKDPLTWEADQDSGLTPVLDLKKGNLSLTKNRWKEEEKEDKRRGDYVCTLEFENGLTLNRTIQVNVLQITSSTGTELISGQQVNLTCSLGHPLPSYLRLKWFPPEQSSQQSLLTSDPTHLTIPAVWTGDSGKWRCELWQNNTRLTSAVIALKIEPKLSVWMLVIICGVTVIIILLLILAVILCRRRQRKTRHLRHRLCQCKNPKPKGFYRS